MDWFDWLAVRKKSNNNNNKKNLLSKKIEFHFNQLNCFEIY